ncbi:MAG: hypothetical protein IPK95_09615 [Cellvibrionales bacterium]|nr:hypothetical protein [Cellvibrionales bacterium]
MSRLDEVDFVVVNCDASTVFQKEQLITKLVRKIGLMLPVARDWLWRYFCGDTSPCSGRHRAIRSVFQTLRDLGLDVIEHAFPIIMRIPFRPFYFPLDSCCHDRKRCGEVCGVCARTLLCAACKNAVTCTMDIAIGCKN